jgi:hypothetical protein
VCGCSEFNKCEVAIVTIHCDTEAWVIHQPKELYVPLQVSDAVRTDMGLEGIVVSLTDDGLAAFIETVEIGRYATIVRYRLDRLTKVSEQEAGAA